MATESIQLRQAILKDLEWLTPFYEDLMKPYYNSLNLVWDSEKFVKAFDPVASSIILLDSLEIGYLKVEHSQEQIYLGDIQLKPEFQNRGIGTRLIRDVISQAASEKLPLRLRVLKGNPAINLYRKLGFIVVEENETSHILCHQAPKV